MKFMKLGTQADTIHTEEATRSVITDLPSDLAITINDVTYLLHKHTLLPKCGLLQRLCSDSDDSTSITIDLHDIPGGEDAFELCAKFCYGIVINISAYNFVPVYCAAKFLRMTESVEKGNFILKLETFFNACILGAWKDPFVALQATVKLPQWSENLGIIRRCIDSIVDKILTPPVKVTWSFTYTRPGYSKKHQQSVPIDWWTEDISDLDTDLFRCIITAIKSTNMLSPQLIGEALHVYACRWLPDTRKIIPPESSQSRTQEQVENSRRIVETVVSLIPTDRGSVSVGFLLRLLSISNYLGVSSVTRAELLRRSSLQLEDAEVSDLLFPSHSPSDQQFYDVDMVVAVLESFIEIWRRQTFMPGGDGPFLKSIRRVGKLIDSYLQVVARDKHTPLSKIVSLAEALPGVARPNHDDLYKTIDIYLKEHLELSKADRKRLCSILDCQKLSPEVCADAVRNELLPLRTVVQALFFDHERDARTTGQSMHLPEMLLDKQRTQVRRDNRDKIAQGPNRESTKAKDTKETAVHDTMTPNGELPLELEQKLVIGEIEEERLPERRKNIEEGQSGSNLDPKKLIDGKNRSSAALRKIGKDARG